MLKCSDIRLMFQNTTPNTDGMVEVLGVAFEADEPAIFGEPSEDYIRKEIDWYNSCSLTIEDMPKPPRIWEKISGIDGIVNSNYGWCIYSKENGYQYGNVLNELSMNPESRRGCMIYTRPSMHRDSTAHGKDDFMCTNAVNYFIRDNTLYAVVQMRSNDIIYGYKNDWAWQMHVAKQLAEQLCVDDVKIIWNAASLHMYPNHVEKFLCKK